ncbi:VPS10 domain-containing protein [Gracilimonas mengyeensis]|uniref:Sortilin, neurotensin receptor 3 n=1 Tax=Gracilimonas mengyeensis TaxID=1302730 RepID=A0A521BBP1_9BACT|nr:glycosyl hydrolase [Gracilimonas mengyeensis]SMO44478.1 Sortilin, neurotensin receptor 3 [Gracilimonas mengyeensis]
MTHQNILYKLVGSIFLCAASLLIWGLSSPVQAQIFGHGEDVSNPTYEQSLFQELEYRNIGPFRGGRSVAVSGHADQPHTYYAGFTGGGVYKTTDGGINWNNVSDGYFKTGSVGAVSVAPSNQNVIYTGMGETCIRGNMSAGDGMYRSVDGGKTWQHIGLGDSHFIGEIVVHPTNEDIVWVAVLGHAFGNEGNSERGVFKTTDGGKNWERVLYHNEKTGAVDIEIDPTNPRILYASLWEAYRNPWEMSSGGEGSGLYKSVDGGETWENISQRPGMPKGLLGKIGLAISPVNPDRVWAIIENDNGGVFRSDDSGATWQRTNKNRNLRQRAWYYTHIVAGTESEDEVFVLNVGFYKSTDGGSSFDRLGTPHGDHHDLWIDPNDSKRMVIADDGGGQVSYNGGESWSSYYKYATAQFYQVITDNQFPYYIYGAQQDNSTVGIKSRTAGSGITERDWAPVAGGESGYIAPDPDDPNVTYGGSYGGYFNKFNDFTNQSDRIDVWPDNPMGAGAENLKYRFQWTFPIYISPHNSDVLYATSQYVHRSTDEGMSWEDISPDLTRNDKSKQGESGGPLTKDDTSVEYYNTIFTFAESTVEPGVLWAGADDGLIHVSRDNGETWTNVTPEGMPEAMASIIDASPHDPATAYLAATRYKFDDFSPMLYKTDNYGRSWTKITNGIPEGDFTRTIREDPNKEGLLYAGTETGVYVSFNDGELWQPLQLNLPAVPITDLTVHKRDKDLIIATQGRSFWVLDDLSVLHQLSDEVSSADYYLYEPENTYLFGRHSEPDPGETVGENPKDGVVVYYTLNNVPDAEVKLEFLEPDGDLIRTFSSKEDLDGKPVKESEEFYEEEDNTPSDVLSINQGQNMFEWNMRYPGAADINGTQILWSGSTIGPRAVPGTYQVRLLVDDEVVGSQEFVISKDPRIETTQEDFQAQFDLQQTIIAKLDTTHKTINRIREVRDEINKVKSDFTDSEEVQERADAMLKVLAEVEGELMQVKAESFQDVLNYEIKLNNKLASLANTVASGDGRPTEQQYAVYEDLAQRVDEQFEKVEPIFEGELPNLIEEIEQRSIPIEN